MVFKELRMNWYPWLCPYFKQLINNYLTGRWHYALLIKSLPGMGSNVLIYAVSRFLMCQYPEKYKSCNKCRNCQLMQVQTHPDYYIVKSKENRIMLGIDIVREITKKIYEHAKLGRFKIVWIKEIMSFTEEAINALLKIIEEPPENTYFFLSCYELRRLPTTLRSRCYIYRLNVPNEEWSINWLAHKLTVPLKSRISAVRLCSGAPIAALEQLQPKIWLQREQICNKLTSILENNNWFSLLDTFDNEKILQKLHWLTSLLLDAIKLQQDITESFIINIDVLPLLDKLAKNLSNHIIQEIFYNIYKIYKHLLLSPGINYELLLANLLLRIESFIKPDKI